MNSKNTVFVLLGCGFIDRSLTTSVQCSNDNMSKRLERLERENERLSRKMDRQNELLVSKIQKLEDELREQRVLDSQLVAENKHLRDAIEKQEKAFQNFMTNNTAGNKRRRSIAEVPYAFSAVLNHNVMHSGIDQTVKFNSVHLNDGNAYNSQTGVFTVPTEGVYLFYLAYATAFQPHPLWMHIVVNGIGKVAGVADSLVDGHDSQGTNLVMLHLHKGDSVWVTTFHNPDVNIYGSRPFTTFSGVLLYQYY